MGEAENPQNRIKMMVSMEHSYIMVRDLDLPSAMYHAMRVQREDPTEWLALYRESGCDPRPFVLLYVMGVFWKGLMTDMPDTFVADRADLCLYGRDINATDWAVLRLMKRPVFVSEDRITRFVGRDVAREDFTREDVRCRLERHMFGTMPGRYGGSGLDR